MSDAVHDVNEQLEKLAELAIVLFVGAILPCAAPPLESSWFLALSLVALRSVAGRC